VVGARRRNRRTRRNGQNRLCNQDGDSCSLVRNVGELSAICQPQGQNVSMLRLATGALLVFAGTIWILQGFDFSFAPQSFMTGNVWWVVWGAIAVITGGWLVWVGWPRR
jgi:hypothetical protein